MKKFIKKILGISELEKENQRLKNSINVLKTEASFIREQILIGVDHHIKYQNSFAVICLKGKTDYVNFFRLKPNQIREIAMFLKKFDSNNAYIDTMPGMRDLFLK